MIVRTVLCVVLCLTHQATAVLDCHSPDVEKAANSSDGRSTTYLSTITMKCFSGYSLNPKNISDNSFQLTCDSERNWTPERTCKKITCGPPPSLRTATFKSKSAKESKHMYGDTVTYMCKGGHFTRENGRDTFTSTCLSNGTWSYQQSCEEQRYYHFTFKLLWAWLTYIDHPDPADYPTFNVTHTIQPKKFTNWDYTIHKLKQEKQVKEDDSTNWKLVGVVSGFVVVACAATATIIYRMKRKYSSVRVEPAVVIPS